MENNFSMCIWFSQTVSCPFVAYISVQYTYRLASAMCINLTCFLLSLCYICLKATIWSLWGSDQHRRKDFHFLRNIKLSTSLHFQQQVIFSVCS